MILNFYVFRIFLSLPIYSQHLLVLLFGTFRVIHSNCRRANTGMTAEALGVSVAPSFFHTCVSEGKVAKPEEVQKFKVILIIEGWYLKYLMLLSHQLLFFVSNSIRDIF